MSTKKKYVTLGKAVYIHFKCWPKATDLFGKGAIEENKDLVARRGDGVCGQKDRRIDPEYNKRRVCRLYNLNYCSQIEYDH